MTEITIDSLKANGFEVDHENSSGLLWLKKQIDIGDSKHSASWHFVYELRRGIFDDFYLEADGGHDDHGTFCLKHFRYIEQMDTVVAALKGVVEV